MSIKTKLAMGIATGALAVSMIGGGTYAYFSDIEVNKNNSFTAGTLDINVEGEGTNNEIINVGNLKPGDKMTHSFKLNNPGSLDVSRVLLRSIYNVGDAKGDNAGANFGEHIKVTITNIDKNEVVVSKIALNALAETNILGKYGSRESSILKAGDTNNFKVEFEFVENNEDQNVFQGDSLSLEWTFDAKQTLGESK